MRFTLIILGSAFLFGNAIAGQWKPLCIEGSSCNAPYQVGLAGGAGGYFPIDPYAAGPLVTSEGILLLHTPHELPVLDMYSSAVRHVFQLSTSGSKHLYPGELIGHLSNVNALQSSSGRTFIFGLYGYGAWTDSDSDIVNLNWSGTWAPGLNNAAFTGPPIEVGNSIYAGIRHGGWQGVYRSVDDGNTWSAQHANIRIGETRFNLLANPEKNALWAIQEEFFEIPGSLWESSDHGSNWQQVDDGSFPAWTVRVVHDPENPLISYALTNHGLYVSVNRGVSWQATSMTEPVHGLVFVERMETLTCALVVGTDTGVKMSVDGAVSWVDMGKGLLDIPHTVTYGHGMLIATSDAGYFTCNSVDCVGAGQALPAEEDSGIVDVVEFYNTNLEHYFITASQADIDFVDQGLAGEGWVQTGESFLAWALGTTVEAANVCRFYGSYYPGPNSHFFTLSTQDCSSLMTMQETTPASEPRWNFEGYAFSIMPPLQDQDQDQSCSEGFIPVYRAYNNGYQKGEDSNHRYVTDRDLLIPLIEKGWSEEGVAFCSPTE